MTRTQPALHIPPPKRRKIFKSKQTCTKESIPEAVPSIESACKDREGPVHSVIQHKQASSSVPFFPIFKPNFNSDIRQEQGGKKKKTRAKATTKPSKINSIRNHFITLARESGPDDPGEAAGASP